VTERVGVFRLPMRARFRRVDEREGVLIHGPAGVGEFSPFWDYDAVESAAWLRAALEAAYDGHPLPLRDHVPVNCTVPAVGPVQAAAIASGDHGCRTAKVKVAEPGQSLEDDVARVAAVRRALGDDGRLRIDANGGWSVEEAVHAVAVLGEFDLEYVEQPVATLEEMVEVRRRVAVPVAADESIRRADDPLRVRRMGAADIAVLKVQPLGGVRRCLAIAEQIDLPVVVSSALESSVGLAAGVALAAALPSLPYACGLGTAAMFTRDLADPPLLPTGGVLPVRTVTPDAALLARAAVDRETRDRWMRRLDDCRAVVESRSR
jgi:O-succinylbenzoate synthase